MSRASSGETPSFGIAVPGTSAAGRRSSAPASPARSAAAGDVAAHARTPRAARRAGRAPRRRRGWRGSGRTGTARAGGGRARGRRRDRLGAGSPPQRRRSASASASAVAVRRRRHASCSVPRWPRRARRWLRREANRRADGDPTALAAKAASRARAAALGRARRARRRRRGRRARRRGLRVERRLRHRATAQHTQPVYSLLEDDRPAIDPPPGRAASSRRALGDAAQLARGAALLPRQVPASATAARASRRARSAAACSRCPARWSTRRAQFAAARAVLGGAAGHQDERHAGLGIPDGRRRHLGDGRVPPAPAAARRRRLPRRHRRRRLRLRRRRRRLRPLPHPIAARGKLALTQYACNACHLHSRA